MISIIIPIYNSEEYLRECLDSVVGQTYKDLEIICVDDGSTDNSAYIIAEYAKNDNRIVHIKGKHNGVTAARKLGVDKAKGDYIGFVDSDDWIEPDMYECMLEGNGINADIISCGCKIEDIHGYNALDIVESGVYEGEKFNYLRENFIFCFEKKEVGIRAYHVTKLFRSSLLKNCIGQIPNEIVLYEDKMMLMTFMLEAESAVIIDKVLYHYIQRKNSAMHKQREDYLSTVDAIYRYMMVLFTHEKFSEKMKKQAQLYIIQIIFRGINENMGFSCKDMFRVDSEWQLNVPYGSKILLYGAGRFGILYYRQLINNDRGLQIVDWADGSYETITDTPIKISSPDVITQKEFDFIAITFRKKELAKRVMDDIHNQYNVPYEKMFHLESDELFWKYAKDSGFLKE